MKTGGPVNGEDKACEELIEQQLRELTLLPLNIRYLSPRRLRRRARPRGGAGYYALSNRPAAVLAAAHSCR